MQVNQTYQNTRSNESFRIIAIENGLVYYRPLFQKQSSYSLKTISLKTLFHQLHSGEIVIIDDPFSCLKEKELSEKCMEKARQNWKLVDELWSKHKEELLNRSTRTQALKNFAQAKGCSFSKIGRLLSSFFEKGMNISAVAPEYRFIPSHDPSSDQKTGVKTKTPTPQTSEVEDIFKKCYQKYYLSREAVTITEAYEQMIQHYFKPMNKPYPSYLLFWRWIKKQDAEKEIKIKQSEKAFNLEHRILTGSTIGETNGPGEVFELDATILDCHIVSRSDRNLVIGRPVLYLIVDRYSKMITGMNVGLKYPSWTGAIAAMENMAADKVSYCRQFNIEINESDWPISGCFPAVIVGDRGEMICSYSDHLVDSGLSDLNNPPPYRGDLKPNVERRFGMVNSKIRSFIDGAIQKEYRSRGDKDPRDKAKLNLDEITAVCIHCVLAINKRMNPKYALSEDQITFGVAPIPLEIWNYGVSHCLHALKKVDLKVLRQKLLPSKLRSIKRDGIHLNNLIYTAPDPQTQNLLLNLMQKKEKYSFVYDPADMSEGYLLTPQGEIRLTLSNAFESFKGMSFEEISFYRERSKNIMETRRSQDMENRIALNESLSQINNSVPKPDSGIPKASRKKNMRENRKKEQVGFSQPPDPAQKTPFFVNEQDPLSNYDIYIEQVLKETELDEKS